MTTDTLSRIVTRCEVERAIKAVYQADYAALLIAEFIDECGDFSDAYSADVVAKWIDAAGVDIALPRKVVR